MVVRIYIARVFPYIYYFVLIMRIKLYLFLFGAVGWSSLVFPREHTDGLCWKIFVQDIEYLVWH